MWAVKRVFWSDFNPSIHVGRRFTQLASGYTLRQWRKNPDTPMTQSLTCTLWTEVPDFALKSWSLLSPKISLNPNTSACQNPTMAQSAWDIPYLNRKIFPFLYQIFVVVMFSYFVIRFILNSQYFWKWTNANPMKIIGQDATASKL